MQGVKVARPQAFKRLTSSKRSVSRAYGGKYTASEVKDRIMRAFLIEEFKRFKNINW
jgi:ribosomal protein L34E